MARHFGNRIQVATATTGTGTVTLGAAESGYQTFADGGVSDADTVRYLITDGSDWEIGTGTYTHSGTTMARSVEESSNADALVSLSGSAIVSVIFASADVVVTENAQTIAGLKSFSDGIEVPDNVFRVQDNADATKELAFELSGITTSTTRTVTMPDVSGTIVLTTATQTLTGKTLGATTLSGTLSGADNEVNRVNLKDWSEVTNAIGSTGGGTQDIDLTLGNVVTATVDTSANTFTFSNPTASDECCSFTLILTNGGSQTVTWPASVDWAGATAPTLTTSGVDVLEFMTVDGGTIWNGFVAGLDMS